MLTAPTTLDHRHAALLRGAKALAQEVHLLPLLRTIAAQVSDVLGAERSSIFLYDAAAEALCTVVAEGVDDPLCLGLDRGLAGHVARTRRPVRLADAYADPRFDPSFDAATGFRTRSVLCMPVVGAAGEILGVVQALNGPAPGGFAPDDEALLEAFCSHAAVALERALLTEAYVAQQRADAELALAHEVQMAMLPDVAAAASGRTELHARLAPARAVGGDVYDAFRLGPHRLAVAVGDVAGKGVPAALRMVQTHTLLRGLGPTAAVPANVLAALQRRLRPDGGPRRTPFVTLVYGVLDERTGHFAYASAGHPPPVLVRPGRPPRLLARARNLPLGAPTRRVRADGLPLAPGDLLLLYTDGVLEARDAAGAEFGPDRLCAVLARCAGAPAGEVVDAVWDAVRAFEGGTPPHDDPTVLALRYRG